MDFSKESDRSTFYEDHLDVFEGSSTISGEPTSSRQVMKQADLILVATVAMKIANHALSGVSVGNSIDSAKRVDVSMIRQQMNAQRLLLQKLHRVIGKQIGVDTKTSIDGGKGITKCRVISKYERRALVTNTFKYLMDTEDRYAIVEDPDYLSRARRNKTTIRSRLEPYARPGTYRDPVTCERRHYKPQQKQEESESNLQEQPPPSCSEETWSSTASVDLMGLTSVPPSNDSFAEEHAPNDQSEQQSSQQENHPSIDAGEHVTDTSGNGTCHLV